LPKSIALFCWLGRCTTVGWSAPDGLYPGGKAGDGVAAGAAAAAVYEGVGARDGMRFQEGCAGAEEGAGCGEVKKEDEVGCRGGRPDDEGVVVERERL